MCEEKLQGMLRSVAASLKFAIGMAVGGAAFIASSFLCLANVRAQDQSVDWKLFGSTSVGGDSQIFFYDANGVNRLPNGNIEVWSKGVLAKDLDLVLSDSEAKAVADKIQGGYVPPMAVVFGADKDKLMDFTIAELIANTRGIHTLTRLQFELDCKKHMVRNLSGTFEVSEKMGSLSKPTSWKAVGPETNSSENLGCVVARDFSPGIGFTNLCQGLSEQRPFTRSIERSVIPPPSSPPRRQDRCPTSGRGFCAS